MPEKLTQLPTKVLVMQTRGEITFQQKFTAEDIERVFRYYFECNYMTEVAGMTLDFDWENTGGITVSGHKDISKG